MNVKNNDYFYSKYILEHTEACLKKPCVYILYIKKTHKIF